MCAAFCAEILHLSPPRGVPSLGGVFVAAFVPFQKCQPLGLNSGTCHMHEVHFVVVRARQARRGLAVCSGRYVSQPGSGSAAVPSPGGHRALGEHCLYSVVSLEGDFGLFLLDSFSQECMEEKSFFCRVR